MRRLLAFMLALGMLSTVPLAPGTGASGAAGKLDEYLLKVLAGDPDWTRWADEDGRYEVLLAGPGHREPVVMPASREAWNQFWAAEAAPFFAEVRAALLPGDLWTWQLATVPVVKLELTPDRFLDFAALPEVSIVALDWPEAVRILEEPQGPGLLMGQSVGMTQAFEVHKLGIQGQGVKLAMIDTGVSYRHPMFLDEFGDSRVTKFFDATNSGCSTHCDTHGHGTHTASTAAGSNVAGGKHQGVAPRADIYGVKIFIGGSGTWEDAQEGLQAAFNLGADITSNSWAGGCTGGGATTETVAKNLALAGLQHVFAAGNSGAGSAGNICPGRNDFVIGVAAVDKNKVIAGFSSGGPCPAADGSMTRICPDLSAVGVNVEAAWLNNGYNTISGTSMATPHVAGGAVLMYQMNRAFHDQKYDVPSQELELFFEQHAEDLGPAGNDNRYGWGFIRLNDMANDLLTGAQARATVDVSVAKAEMRWRDTNTATLVVSNVGPKAITGTAKVVAGGELGHDGKVYLSEAVTLGPGESATFSADIPGAGLDPTTYHVVGSLDYTFTSDTGSTVRNAVEDFTTFVLRGVKMLAARNLMPQVFAGNGTSVLVTLKNVGNEPASQVQLREGVPLLGYVVEPQARMNNPPYGVFSNPAPSSVAPDTENRTFNMFYTPSSINPGQAFGVNYKLRVLAPGTYAFQALVDYVDGIGDAYRVTLTQTQDVVCPTVKVHRDLPVIDAC